MDVIINVEILILIHKSLSQYAPNDYYRHPQPYTQAAYFELYDDQEYKWPKYSIKSKRKRKIYTDYFSAELVRRSRGLKCKCRRKKHSYDGQLKNCYCDKLSDKNDFIPNYEPYKIMPIQLPATYCSLPWFQCDQDNDTTDEDSRQKNKHKRDEDERDKKDEDSREHEDKNKKDFDEDGKYKDSREHRDKDKKNLDEDGKDKDSREHRNKDKKDLEEDGKDKDSREHREKDKNGKNIYNDENDGKDKKDKDIDNNDKKNKEKNGNHKNDADKQHDEKADDEKKRGSDEVEHSTEPYQADDGDKLLLQHFPKKKQCFRNKFLNDNKGSRVGRYFYNDLIMRPTLDGNSFQKSTNSKKILYNRKSFV